MGGRTGADYAGLTGLAASGPVWTGEIRVREDLLTWPLYRSKPRRILVDPLSDLFHENLADPIIDKLHAVMAVAHWHLFLLLSKRAERMSAYYRDPQTPPALRARPWRWRRRCCRARSRKRSPEGVRPGVGSGPAGCRGSALRPPPVRSARRAGRCPISGPASRSRTKTE
jgi:hypothetical protein